MTGKRILVWILGLYLVGSLVFLFAITLPASRQGLSLINFGQSKLLQNPEQAKEAFTEASQTFEDSFSTLHDAPFLIKVATPLPPFRWQVRLGKAAHALAEAGTITATMREHFPPIDRSSTGDIAPLFVQNSARYAQWYQDNQANIRLLEANLAEADRQLAGVPYWTALSERKNLADLHAQVRSNRDALHNIQALGQAILDSLGQNDANSHRWALSFINGKNQVSYSLIAQNGSITDLEYNNAQKTEGTLMVDVEVLRNLTTLTGPIRLSDASLTSTASISELLFKLYGSLGAKPELFPEVVRQLHQGLTSGLIRISAQNSRLTYPQTVGK